MKITRRNLILTTAAFAVPRGSGAFPKENSNMYGLISRILCNPGQRDKLVAILLEGTSAMPGCLSYVVAKDRDDADGLWVTEVWESQQRHQASLSLPAVQQALAVGRPLIKGFGERFVTEPLGGHGL